MNLSDPLEGQKPGATVYQRKDSSFKSVARKGRRARRPPPAIITGTVQQSYSFFVVRQVLAKFPEICPRFTDKAFMFHYKGVRYLFAECENEFGLAGYWREVLESIITDRKEEMILRGEAPSKMGNDVFVFVVCPL